MIFIYYMCWWEPAAVNMAYMMRVFPFLSVISRFSASPLSNAAFAFFLPKHTPISWAQVYKLSVSTVRSSVFRHADWL